MHFIYYIVWFILIKNYVENITTFLKKLINIERISVS